MCELGFVHSRLTRPPLASSALFVVACTLQDENSKISIVACDWWPGFILWGAPRPTNWQIGKFIGSYGYTAKGHQCQAACGRPVFCFGGGGGLALCLVLPLFRFRWVGEHRVLRVVPAITIHTAAREILGKL